MYRYFKTVTNTSYISSRKSKGLSAESIKPPRTSDNSLIPELNYIDYKIRVKFTGSCLKQPKMIYAHKKVANIYIVYELGASTSHIDDPTLKNVYLVQLLELRMLILISMGIQVMELGLIKVEVFHFQVMDMVKMY